MSYDVIKENVPAFYRRVGDRVIEGSNNVTMVFGTDRAAPGDADLDSGLGHINASGKGKGTGTWHLVTGRAGLNPNFTNDSSYIYVSMKTDVDDNIQSSEEFKTNSIPTIILKTDSLRLIAKKNFKLLSNKTYITLDGENSVTIGVPGSKDSGKIYLGSSAKEQVIFGNVHMKTFNAFVERFNALVNAYNSHFHMGNMGVPTSPPSGVPATNPAFNPMAPPSPANPMQVAGPAGAVQTAKQMTEADLSKVTRTI